MQVDLSSMPPCYEGFCQGAMACVDQKCGPCELDSRCQSGEICVLDYCVRRELADCRRASDCPAEQFCVLTGLSEDHQRQNSTMKSLCSGSTPTLAQSNEPLPAELFVGTESVHARLNAALEAAGTP